MWKSIKNLYRNIFFTRRFYLIWISLIFIIFLGYWIPVLFIIGKYLWLSFAVLSIFDIFYLFSTGNIKAERILPVIMSNGDDNTVLIKIQNKYNLPVQLSIIDELPVQFQKRDFNLNLSLKSGETKQTSYSVLPVKRGIYVFHFLNIFVSSPLKLGLKRWRLSQPKQVKVYPSFIQMRQYELLAFANKSRNGLKKIRRLGHTLEFEQIKTYQSGDDYRTINWKATAKHQKLMVNQYQDEKSQNIYSLLDMGRHMALPFKGMTLLDYAINSSLALTNIALKKNDKAGILSFEKKMHSFIKPGYGRQHLHQIFETLYAQKTGFLETDYEHLFYFIRKNIPNRSLLMLYTNFEHFNSLKRQLPFLKKIAQKHLLVVIIFKNTELQELIDKPAKNKKTLYHKIIAQDFEEQKLKMLKTLQKHKIHSIYTSPENLTGQSITKYMQLKARGLI